MPGDIEGVVDEPDHRPGSDFIVCGSYHGHVVCVDCPAFVAGIRCLCIYRFNYIISSVQRFITDELYLHCSVAELFNREDGHILVLVTVKGRTQHYGMDISFGEVGNGNVINHVVTVKVEVVYPGVLVVEASLEGFKGLRLLEEIHDCVEVQIVTRETQVFLRVILRHDCRH